MNIYWKIVLMPVVAAAILYLWRIIFKKDFSFTSRHIDSRSFNSSEKELIDSIKNAMKASKFLRIRFDKEKKEFYAITYPTFWSFSEIVKVKLKGSTEIEFISKCAFPLQVFDWFKNERNANKFYKKLNVN